MICNNKPGGCRNKQPPGSDLHTATVSLHHSCFSDADRNPNAPQAKHDPIPSLKRQLLQGGILTEVGLQAIEKEVQGIIEEAVEFGDTSPEPPIETLEKDLYV